MFEVYESKRKRHEYTTDMSDGWNVCGMGRRGGCSWGEGNGGIWVRV